MMWFVQNIVEIWDQGMGLLTKQISPWNLNHAQKCQ